MPYWPLTCHFKREFISLSFFPTYLSFKKLSGTWTMELRGKKIIINVFSLNSLIVKYLKLWQFFLSWIKLPNEIQPSHHLNYVFVYITKLLLVTKFVKNDEEKRSFQIGFMLVRLCLHFHVAHYIIAGCYNVDHELDTTYLARMSILPTKSLKFYPHL